MNKTNIKFEEFAIRMSELFFDLRSDNLSDLISPDDREISESYINEILNDKNHCYNIKEKIRLSVLKDIIISPNNYKQKKNVNGVMEYIYTPEIYDHAYTMDEYIENQFVIDNPIIKPRYVCDNCGSDNVQIKAWVKPNNNNEYDSVIEDDDDYNDWCEDCQSHINVMVINMNVTHKIIGYQVVNHNSELHPDISASFCVYSLPQANKMINNEIIKWSLITIYNNIIEKPTLMFNGDPRKPDETIMNILLKK